MTTEITNALDEILSLTKSIDERLTKIEKMNFEEPVVAELVAEPVAQPVSLFKFIQELCPIEIVEEIKGYIDTKHPCCDDINNHNWFKRTKTDWELKMFTMRYWAKHNRNPTFWMSLVDAETKKEEIGGFLSQHYRHIEWNARLKRKVCNWMPFTCELLSSKYRAGIVDEPHKYSICGSSLVELKQLAKHYNLKNYSKYNKNNRDVLKDKIERAIIQDVSLKYTNVKEEMPLSWWDKIINNCI